jgi:hypothetical protein
MGTNRKLEFEFKNLHRGKVEIKVSRKSTPGKQIESEVNFLELIIKNFIPGLVMGTNRKLEFEVLILP